MISQKNIDGHQFPLKQGQFPRASSQHCHFVQAGKIIENWPEWKRNIGCTPISTNVSLAGPPPNQTQQGMHFQL
jgi:hypothetical protein